MGALPGTHVLHSGKTEGLGMYVYAYICMYYRTYDIQSFKQTAKISFYGFF